MVWPTKQSSVRKAVFHVLLHPDLADVACTAEQLAGVLTSFLSEASERHVVTGDHIKNAFRDGAGDEFPYRSLNIDDAGDDRLVFYKSREGSSRGDGDRTRVWKVTRCRIGGSASAGNATKVHPLDKVLRHSNIGDAVPKDVKDAFVRYFVRSAGGKAKATKTGGKSAASVRPLSASAKPSNSRMNKRPKPPTSPSLSQKERDLAKLIQKRDHQFRELDGVLSEIERLQQEIDSENKMASVEASIGEGAEGMAAVSPGSAAEGGESQGKQTMHYMISGVEGKTLGEIDLEGRVVLKEDLIKNMHSLPNELVGDGNASRRVNTGYRRVNHGSGESWCPNSHILLAKNRQNEIMGHHNLVKKTGKLFDHSQCTIGDEAKRWMAAFDMHAYGASDEGKVMAHAGALSAFLTVQLGYKISPGDIGRALPSRATQASMEFNLAADCLIKVCHEIKKDKARHLGLITDHGHRGDQDHFVKLVIWAGFDEDENWTMKYFCLDVDSGGHSALEAAVAVKKSVTAFQDLLNEVVGERVEIKVITGDSGGGAKVQSLHPALVDCDVMDLDSQLKPCGLHGGVKPLERACVETVGAQGIGARTPIQLSWLFVRLMKYLRTSLDRKGLDDLWKSGVEALSTNPTWQRQAKEHSQHGQMGFDSDS